MFGTQAGSAPGFDGSLISLAGSLTASSVKAAYRLSAQPLRRLAEAPGNHKEWATGASPGPERDLISPIRPGLKVSLIKRDLQS